MCIYRIGIIGHGADKFNNNTEESARRLIFKILSEKLKSTDQQNITIVSGHSPVGGIDIWTEEIADALELSKDLKIPIQHTWNSLYGFKQRNIDIATCSDELHIILVKNYPEGYKGRKFPICYHCGTNDHVKSGACWTGNQARKLNKKVIVHII